MRRLLGLSLAGLLAVPAAWLSMQEPANEGSLDSLTRASAQPTTPPRLAPVSAGLPIPQIEAHSARLADLEPRGLGPRPVSVRIEAIGIEAPIVPVGVDAQNGTTEVPRSVWTIGWYRFGPSPGEDGSAVLIGHVDSRAQGPGAFFRLSNVDPGHLVVIRLSDGSRRSFQVIARRSYPKEHLPSTIFARVGPPSLALVTCGGDFDWGTRSYSDNVVVFAVLKP